MAEAAALLAAMPLLALAPRGDDHHVLVIPPFAGNDDATQTLRRFLDQQGFHGRPWELGRNLGVRRMGGYDGCVARVVEISRESGRPVSLVGWGLGGVHARAVAKIVPNMVRQVISLGAPIGDDLNRTAFGRMYSSANGMDPDPRFKTRLIAANREPPPVPSTAIFTRTDGIVPADMAREIESATTDNIEVAGSHAGLGTNPAVFFVLADRLAQPADQWSPFQGNAWQRAFVRSAVV